MGKAASQQYSAFSLNFAKEVRESVKLLKRLTTAENKERQIVRMLHRRKCRLCANSTRYKYLQVPKINVNISMSSLVRFFGAHFIDLSALQIWLEDITGGEFLEEHLAVGQVALEDSQNSATPGLDMTFNMNIRVIAQVVR